MSGVEKSKIDYRRNRLETLRDNVHRNMVKMREIKKQYPELRMGFMFEVGSLLNAYRDGDLTFEEAKANIEIAVKEKLEWEKQKSLIRQRDKATVAEMFTALRDAGVSMSGKLHRVVPMNEIPEGEYPGKWSGYSVQFQTPVGLMICDSGVGVRGIDVPCVVIVSAGGIQCLKV